VSQGVEATQKSRDVSATEVQQRVLQGSSRYELERLYDEAAFKKPMLNMVFDCSAIEPYGAEDGPHHGGRRAVQRTGPTKRSRWPTSTGPSTSSSLAPRSTFSKAEKTQEIQQIVNLAANRFHADPPDPGPQILLELLRNTRTLGRNTQRFVPSAQEAAQAQMQAQMAAAGWGTAEAPETPQQAFPSRERGPARVGGAPRPRAARRRRCRRTWKTPRYELVQEEDRANE